MMKTTDYFILDTAIRLHSFQKIWMPFEMKKECNPQITIQYHFDRPAFYNIQIYSQKKDAFFMCDEDRILQADPKWTNIHLYANQLAEDDALLNLSVYSYLSTRRTLMFHSSLVDFNGNGIMFIGPSGVGKTTQAELWNHYLGADILNGDIVYVRQNSDGFYGYGSPWHGSSSYFMNSKVKLKAVAALSQGHKNEIQQIYGRELLKSFMDQVFLPHWYADGLTACLASLDDFAAQIPVYSLSCRPDQDSVMLLKEVLRI